jgi:hypothetical protein
MLERGAYPTTPLGFPFGARLLDRCMIGARSKEGVIIERGITVGGSSMIYQSNVMDPPKRLLKAMGIDADTAFCAVRFSQGWDTTDEDIETLLGAIKTIRNFL